MILPKLSAGFFFERINYHGNSFDFTSIFEFEKFYSFLDEDNNYEYDSLLLCPEAENHEIIIIIN